MSDTDFRGERCQEGALQSAEWNIASSGAKDGVCAVRVDREKGGGRCEREFKFKFLAACRILVLIRII
jgi:hypothetical protein